MSKEATGEVRFVGGIWTCRIRTFGRRDSFDLPTCQLKEEAAKRAGFLSAVAKRFRLAQMNEARALEALRIIAGASERLLPTSLIAAEDLLGGRIPIPGRPVAPTFKELGEDWTNGKLADRYPDQIKRKRSKADDVLRLTKHVYPTIGPTPVDRVTLDQCEEIMRKLPPHLSVSTRRNVGQLVTRLMRLAVYPLRYIERSPIPSGFLPTGKHSKALAHLYPDEDRRLMACAQVPLCFRLLWGFLAREGMREGEALALTWADFDLERGAVRLDRNKTDDPRAWALNPHVWKAMVAYRKRFRPDAKPDDYVFTDPAGRALSKFGLAMVLRGHLEAIGLKKQRPELFETTSERRRIRVHDLRGTFVTVSLANGKSEAWISDRTGHRSSQMIARYKRVARTFEELNTGELVPLFGAIPELAIAPPLPHEFTIQQKTSASPTGFEPVSQP